MSSEPPPLRPDPDGDSGETASLPGWVPVLIGVVLASMALLAVFTGLRYRTRTEDRPVVHRTVTAGREFESAGAPGEPEPGASRSLHGAIGASVPDPAAPDTGESTRVTITGGKEGVISTYQASARRGMTFAVTPSDAVVYVNEQEIGTANQFSGPEGTYEFANEGKFTIRFVAPGYDDSVYIITADSKAADETVVIRDAMKRREKASAPATKKPGRRR
ncbi:MAG: hypothetical protein ABI718_05175 [Acidobacteriota bacterium]